MICLLLRRAGLRRSTSHIRPSGWILTFCVPMCVDHWKCNIEINRLWSGYAFASTCDRTRQTFVRVCSLCPNLLHIPDLQRGNSSRRLTLQAEMLVWDNIKNGFLYWWRHFYFLFNRTDVPYLLLFLFICFFGLFSGYLFPLTFINLNLLTCNALSDPPDIVLCSQSFMKSKVRCALQGQNVLLPQRTYLFTTICLCANWQTQTSQFDPCTNRVLGGFHHSLIDIFPLLLYREEALKFWLAWISDYPSQSVVRGES